MHREAPTIHITLSISTKNNITIIVIYNRNNAHKVQTTYNIIILGEDDKAQCDIQW